MPNTIAVFGATGGLGQHVVAQALAEGFQVRALARTPAKLEAHERLTVVQGDFEDAGAVAATITGSDAVLSCIGHTKGQEPRGYGRGMQHVVDAMNVNGCTRLLAISGAGLELDGDQTSLGRRLIILLLKVFARRLLAAKQFEWEVIRVSALDWTLVRVARMVEGAPTGRVAASVDRVVGSPVVAYADVAAWMLERVEQGGFHREAPFVSGG